MSGKFVSDIRFDNHYYAVIVRAPMRSAALRVINQEALPEHYTLYTAADIPAAHTIDVFDCSVPIFAENCSEYCGEALGILTGPDPLVLESIKKQLQFSIEPPEPKISSSSGYHWFGAPITAHGCYSSSNDPGTTEDMFAAAGTIIHSSWSVAPQYCARSEPMTVIAVPDGGQLHIYLATQYPMHVRRSAAAVLGISEDAVIVHTTEIGETSNELLWYPSVLACQCVLAAVHIGKPVCLCLSPQECLSALPKTPALSVYHKSAVSYSNHITAMHIFIVIQSGAFCPLIHKIIQQMIAAACGPYHIPHYRIEIAALKTPHGPTDIFESWGDSFVTNALEHHAACIIRRRNVSPDQWRMQMLKPEHRAAFLNLFTAITKESNFLRKDTAYKVFNKAKNGKHDGRWRGIGLAAGFQYSGCSADFTYSVEITLNIHNTVSIKAEPISVYVKKMIQKIITKKLEIPEDRILFTELSTDSMHTGAADTAANTACIIPSLVEQCINDLQEQQFRAPLPITVQRTYRIVPPTIPKYDTLFVSATPAVCAVELELDPVCYDVTVLGIWLVCNPGKVYNKEQLISSLQKNIQSAFSRTFKEALQYTQDSHIYLPQHEYRIILPNETPEAVITLIESGKQMTALDSIAYNILPAAYITALNQILITVPAVVEKLPILPQDIFHVLIRNGYDNTVSP